MPENQKTRKWNTLTWEYLNSDKEYVDIDGERLLVVIARPRLQNGKVVVRCPFCRLHHEYERREGIFHPICSFPPHRFYLVIDDEHPVHEFEMPFFREQDEKYRKTFATRDRLLAKVREERRRREELRRRLLGL